MLQHRKRTQGTRAASGSIFYLSPKQFSWLSKMVYELVNKPMDGWKVVEHGGGGYWFYYNDKEIKLKKARYDTCVIPGVGHRHIPGSGYVEIGKKLQ